MIIFASPETDQAPKVNVPGFPGLFHPRVHILITDLIPSVVAFSCTALVIFMNGFVGVLDFNNMTEIFVVKRRGGQVRTEIEQDVYDMGQLRDGHPNPDRRKNVVFSQNITFSNVTVPRN